MAKILSFDEWVKSLYDYNGNGKIDVSERAAYKQALNRRNKAQTYQLYAQYVAQTEKSNELEAGRAQQQAVTAAALSGDATAAALLTGDTKQNLIKNYGKWIVVGLIGLAAVAFIILKN